MPLKIDPTSQEKLQREREFHDDAFSSDLRESTNKYYALTQIEYDDYVARLEPLVSCADVLEFGCGPYGYIYDAAKTASSATAIDLSPVAIEISKQKAAQSGVEANFLVMNCEKMEFPDNSFDVIFGCSILHHLDLEKTFAEMRRVLRPKGVILFTEPLGHNPLINFYRFLTPRLRTEDEHPFKESDIELMAERFDSLKTRHYHLTTFTAVPFGSSKHFPKIRDFFHRIDQGIFRLIPSLKRNAWMCLLEASVVPKEGNERA